MDTEAIARPADPPLRDRIAEAICALLPEVLGRRIEQAAQDTRLLDALGLTSTTGLELVLRIEESLELEISVEDLDRSHFETIGSLADYIAANLIAED